MTTILVCGDRTWGNGGNYPDEEKRLYEVLDEEHANEPITRIVEGEAPGADTLAREWAVSRGVPFVGYPARWGRFGRAAGPLRNQEMLDEEDIDYVVAFHNDIQNSKGTRDMVSRAMKNDIPVRVVSL